MKWSSAVSGDPSLEGAVDECAASVLDGLEGRRPDLAFVFPSAAHAADYGDVPELVRRTPRRLPAARAAPAAASSAPAAR